jgi:hypothetical protein
MDGDIGAVSPCSQHEEASLLGTGKMPVLRQSQTWDVLDFPAPMPIKNGTGKPVPYD